MTFEPARVSQIRSLLSPDYSSGGLDAAPEADVPGGPGGSYGPAGSTLSSATGSVYGLNKDDFLKLFLAQLQNQDPTSPVDDKEFLGQLAQLTQIDTLQQVQKSLAGSQLANAAGLIGKQVAGADVDGKACSGVVSAVVQSNDAGLVLKVGDQYIKPANVATVDAAPTA